MNRWCTKCRAYITVDDGVYWDGCPICAERPSNPDYKKAWQRLRRYNNKRIKDLLAHEKTGAYTERFETGKFIEQRRLRVKLNEILKKCR